MTGASVLRGLVAASLWSALAACDKPAPPPPKPGLGNVMVQVARRFELVGRATVANRFELAEFEAGEIEETFEDDVPGAELPKEGPTQAIPALAKAFLATNAHALREAAAKKDRAALEGAFRQAAAACNGCHEASGKGFIHVPSEPGAAVPEIDPAPAASAR